MNIQDYKRMTAEEMEYCLNEIKNSRSWSGCSYATGRARGVMAMANRVSAITDKEYDNYAKRIREYENKVIDRLAQEGR